jgi:hypothetical protein
MQKHQHSLDAARHCAKCGLPAYLIEEESIIECPGFDVTTRMERAATGAAATAARRARRAAMLRALKQR